MKNGSELFSYPTSFHNTIFRYLLTRRDDSLENMGETNGLAYKIFSSGFRT